jgi:toxin HigB-1
MLIGFSDKGTKDVFDGTKSARARRTLPVELWQAAQDKMEFMNAAVSINDLRVPPSNHLEALKGDRKGQHSIRINTQYRICFRWTDVGPESVEIVDYH